MRQRPQLWPRTRVGHCCGCRALADLPLYRIGECRYRCRECFKREMGCMP